jgi:glycosyltransferase involved in cell wall biosynthesis
VATPDAFRAQATEPSPSSDRTREKRPRVLVVADYYAPGFRAGGPIRALENLIAELGDEFAFFVLTRDRDLGEGHPYPGVPVGIWHARGRWALLYLPPRGVTMRGLAEAARGCPHEVLYLNSFFSRLSVRLLLLRGMSIIPRAGLVIAPRGEFSPGALGINQDRKRAYLWIARSFGLLKGALWQASSEAEAKDIRRLFGERAAVETTPELTARIAERRPAMSRKRVGEASLVFLGRVSPMKNLLGALGYLSTIEGRATLRVVGPVEDVGYWSECERAIAALPPNVQVERVGELPPDRAADELRMADALLLPSLGENFGHAIVEALQVGCPVLISDRTPWRGLEDAGAGWDLPLDEPARWHAALTTLIRMAADRHVQLRKGARAYLDSRTDAEANLMRHRDLLDRAARRVAR